MNFLPTSRIVVIDDIQEEIQAVLDALSKLGIGCVYFRGNKVEELPDFPLRGVRLVVLDMRLDTNAPNGGDAKATASVFHRVISPEDGPLIALLWTKHQEDVSAFRDALFTLEPRFKSLLLTADLEKPLSPKPSDVTKVLRKVRKLERQWAPMNLFWHWERMAHSAAAATTALVAGHVSDSARIEEVDDNEARKTKWLGRLKVILRQLAVAAGGQASGPKTAHKDLLETFLALHADRVEFESQESGKLDLGSLFEGAAGTLTKHHAGKLNSMLLLAAPGKETGVLRPGNVYLRHRTTKRNILFKRTGIKPLRLGVEILGNFERDRTYKQHSDDARVAKDSRPSAAQRAAAKARDKRKTELIRTCEPVLLELTPSCDFAQQTRCVVRLVGGLLVPEAMSGFIIARKDSLRQLQAIHVPGKDGLWTPVFSGRFLFSMTESKDFAATKPDFCLRSQVLGDLRNWYSAQSARLGYLSV